MRVGINGMGRIGRLTLRASFGAFDRPDDDPRSGNRLDVVHVNEIKGGAAATAHLLEFDSLVSLQPEPPQPAPNVHCVVPALVFGA